MEMKTIIVSGIIPLALAVITAIITSKLTLKQEVKKQIYSKRETVYIKLFELLDALQNDRYLVYHREEFADPLKKLRPELYLFASLEVLNIFEPFYQRARSVIEAYWDRFDGREYEMQKITRAECNNETEDDFKQQEEQYMDQHLIDKCFVEGTITGLIAAMRKDIGNKY